MSIIKVKFKTYSTKWHIDRVLKNLESYPILSFDTEVSGVYPKHERRLAKEYLKGENLPIDARRIALQVEANTGLSFPSLVNVTHFVFGLSENESIVIVCDNPALELHVWKWLSNYKGKLLIHNTLFDLKIMYHRVKKFPHDYEDTQLLAKCLINDADVWKAKSGLKDLMGVHYDPSWSLFEEYEPDDLKDPKFLQYASIDGAATIKLWYDILEHIKGE